MDSFWFGVLVTLGFEIALLVLAWLFFGWAQEKIIEWFAWYGCEVCGANYGGDLFIPKLPWYRRILPHLWHSIVTLDRRHRRALAVWRVENGRDPVNGRRMPMEGVWAPENNHYGD